MSICKIIKIQKWFRKQLMSKYHLYNLCSNFWDKDLISLEPIRYLRKNEVFFITTKSGHFMACDAIAWLGYFIQKFTYHPVTKESITPDEVWQCYVIAKRLLDPDHEYLVKCKSTKLHGVIDHERMMIRPVSPLVRINLLKCNTIRKKTKTIVYSLTDSRNSKLVYTKPLTINIDTDKTISFSF